MFLFRTLIFIKVLFVILFFLSLILTVVSVFSYFLFSDSLIGQQSVFTLFLGGFSTIASWLIFKYLTKKIEYFKSQSSSKHFNRMMVLTLLRIFVGLWFSFSLVAICSLILPYLDGVNSLKILSYMLLGITQSLIAWFLFKYLTKKIDSLKQ